MSPWAVVPVFNLAVGLWMLLVPKQLQHLRPRERVLFFAVAVANLGWAGFVICHWWCGR